MIMFLIISLLMAAAIVFIFYPFIVKMPDTQIDEHLSQNVQAHEQRLKQIQMQLDGGLFDDNEAESQRAQSARQLIKDEGQSKRVNTEIKSYMNLPVIMSVLLVAVSVGLYFQKGYQLDLKVAELQSEYETFPTAQGLEELLSTKLKVLEKNSRATALQWHELGVQQLREGQFKSAQTTFEKSFKLYVATPDFTPEEAAYLKARIAHSILMQNQYKPNSQVNELLAESKSFAESNLADQLNQFIDMYNDVEQKGDAASAADFMRLGVNLYYEIGEVELAKPYIVKAGDKAKEESNLNLSARAYAFAAQIVYRANDNQFTDEARQYLVSASQSNPNDYLVLQLAGEHAYAQGEYEVVYQAWSSLMNDPSLASFVSQDMLDKYRITLKKLNLDEEIKGLVTVSVDLDDSLESLASKGQFLYVLARPIGQRMPLAVKKIPMSDVEFPITVSLSDRDAMTAQMTISSHEQFEVVARISLSGIANASEGDPESEAFVATKESEDISILINTLH